MTEKIVDWDVKPQHKKKSLQTIALAIYCECFQLSKLKIFLEEKIVVVFFCCCFFFFIYIFAQFINRGTR